MYRVRFYKNVIVSKDYDIVFDNMLYKYIQNATTYNTVFENYLYAHRSDHINFDDTYMPAPTGKLELDMGYFQKAIDYNYMSIEPAFLNESAETYADIDINATHVGNFLSANYNNNDYYFYNQEHNYFDQTRTDRQLKYYCFIDRIEHLNDVVIIYYTLDIFHTYTPFLNFFNGQLERTNVINKLIDKNLSLFKIPNYKLDINEINNTRCIYRYTAYVENNVTQVGFIKNDINVGDDGTTYCIYFKISLYTLNQSGALSGRQTKIVGFKGSGTLDASLAFLNLLTSASGTTQTSTGFHYEILDTYIIPEVLNKNFYTKMFNMASAATPEVYEDFTITIDGLVMKFYDIREVIYEINNRYPDYETRETIELMPKKDVVQVGFISRLIDVPFNSDTKKLSLIFTLDATVNDLTFTMTMANQTYDLLDLFSVESNINPLDASALAIAKYTRDYNNKQLNLQQDKAGWNIASSVAGLAGGVAVTVATGGAGVGSIMGGVSGIINNAMNIEKITNEREKNNAKLYTSSKANDVTQNDKILNLKYGLIYVSTENYFNTEQVENYINDYGYTIDYKYCLKQMLKSITSAKYSFDSSGNETSTVDALTYFKYNRVDLNGNFSAEVREGLKEIFKKGFKIVNKENKSYFDSCVSIANNKIL